MTRFFLVRHASTDALGVSLSGRLSGVHLNERGRAEVEQLRVRLAKVSLSHVYSSPLERATETAEPVARDHSLPVTVLASLSEVDFGEWTGTPFDALSGSPEWKRFNAYRTGARPPGGELMSEVQCRMTRELERLSDLHPGGAVLVVGHGDPLKSAIAHYTGMPVEYWGRLDIAPASVSVLDLFASAARLVRLNEPPDGEIS